MCGIAGIISAEPIDVMIAKKMNDKLTHRGPDGYGYVISNANYNDKHIDQCIKLQEFNYPHIVLAHRRLAIHDLSEAGHQPMQYKEKYWLIFNGEIYNYIELKAELEIQGYVFHSQTDSEVILAAYDFWGIDCLNKFNGDWALVLFDKVKETILISRDRFGVKPLYYFSMPGIFLFASEIKSILEHPAVQAAPNLEYLHQYMQHGPNEYGSETAFSNIYHFDFSTYFFGSVNDLLQPNKIIFKKFWSLKPNLSSETLDKDKLKNYMQQYYELLNDAVKIRLRADVTVGMNLSGGLDSSSIFYLINDIKRHDTESKTLSVFSSVYHSPGTLDADESALINQMTHLINVNSHQIEPHVDDIPEEYRKMIYHVGTPPESTLMSSWHTAKLIHSHNMRVTLSGQGADEQLAGYVRYIAYYLSTLQLHKAFKYYFLFKSILGSKLHRHVGLTMNILKNLLGKNLTQYIYNKTGRKEKVFTPVNEKLKEDIFSNLVNLHHIDEAVFMAFSIEQRAPFMDYRLVEFLASVPVAYKLAKGNTKYLARKVFHNILPHDINWNKHKLGWPIPEKFWFEGKLKSWMETRIENSEFLKSQQFFSIKKRHKIPLTKKMRLLNIAVWYEVFFNDN
jgi:asparagine synthase (glutamine-hydrolysing)